MYVYMHAFDASIVLYIYFWLCMLYKMNVIDTSTPTSLLHIWQWTSGPVQYCPPFLGL